MLRFLLLPLLLSGRTVRALQHQFHFCNHILASKHSPIGLSFSSKVIHSTRRRPHQRILLSRPHPPSALTRAHCLLWPFQPCASRLQGCKGCAGINLPANWRCYCAICLQVNFLFFVLLLQQLTSVLLDRMQGRTLGASAPASDHTDPLRCQADMGQLPNANGPEPPPPLFPVKRTLLTPSQLGLALLTVTQKQNSFSISQR